MEFKKFITSVLLAFGLGFLIYLFTGSGSVSMLGLILILYAEFRQGSNKKPF